MSRQRTFGVGFLCVQIGDVVTKIIANGEMGRDEEQGGTRHGQDEEKKKDSIENQGEMLPLVQTLPIIVMCQFSHVFVFTVDIQRDQPFRSNMNFQMLKHFQPFQRLKESIELVVPADRTNSLPADWSFFRSFGFLTADTSVFRYFLNSSASSPRFYFAVCVRL